MLRKNLLLSLLACLLVVSMIACAEQEEPARDTTPASLSTTAEPTEETQWVNPGFTLLDGCWSNEDGSITLQINSDGQTWCLENGEVLFRGYLEQTVLTEVNKGYEYRCRYDLYNDGDELLFCYYHDTALGILLEENIDGDIVAEYTCQGPFSFQAGQSADPTAYQGYWMYDSGYLLLIEEDQWFYYANDGELLTWGPVEYDEECAYLINNDGSSGGGRVTYENGTLRDSGEVLTWCEGFPYGNSENPQRNGDMEGEWLYSQQDFLLIFDGIDRFVFDFLEGVKEGNYMYDGEMLFLYFDDESFRQGWLDANGCLFFEDEDTGYYYRYDEG